mmetsp:Transcript_14218/g.36883  ORF Transcript_14218/g.36883 Transcript_14218/m.36883 type:complete len:268 (-) Transcript_14218:617-1420(-)
MYLAKSAAVTSLPTAETSCLRSKLSTYPSAPSSSSAVAAMCVVRAMRRASTQVTASEGVSTGNISASTLSRSANARRSSRTRASRSAPPSERGRVPKALTEGTTVVWRSPSSTPPISSPPTSVPGVMTPPPAGVSSPSPFASLAACRGSPSGVRTGRTACGSGSRILEYSRGGLDAPPSVAWVWVRAKLRRRSSTARHTLSHHVCSSWPKHSAASTSGLRRGVRHLSEDRSMRNATCRPSAVGRPKSQVTSTSIAGKLLLVQGAQSF